MSMNYAELYKMVKESIAGRQAVTTIFIQMRHRTLQADARRCLAQLQDEELVGKDWDTALGGYPVLMKEAENA